MRDIKKILIANRSEIAIRISSATELGYKTVSIYSYEDRFAYTVLKRMRLFVGSGLGPIQAYLDYKGCSDRLKFRM